ncbi:MAG: hypothetical protein C3F13_11355 [Anaerolineales bacterium]|nr:MAG: hypothetical protein C3F13_11355 [Anaerolineales bacterium]
MTTMLLVGLALLLWSKQGVAFSPGQISAKSSPGVSLKGYQSHAEFEKKCGACHAPLSTNLGAKCLACHEAVNQQIQTGQGIHSQIANVAMCAACHPDHRGRDFDPTKASFLHFDHSTTGFRLNFHQFNYDASSLGCTECHQNGSYNSVDNQICLNCHGEHDNQFAAIHPSNYGEDCLACHDGADRMINFAHSETGYPLEGKHEQVACSECHRDSNFTDTPRNCQECHAEPAEHKGVFDQTCETCHSPKGWLPANLNGQTFTHQDTVKFSLALHKKDYAGQVITCVTCHPSDLKSFDLQVCITCHKQEDQTFMTDHQVQFSSSCLDCHDGMDRLSNFDHNTFFPLDGKHTSVDCETCHANKVFKNTPTECYQCHEEPDIHKGVFGQRCAYCHTTDTWSPATLKLHTFPINHGLDDPALQLNCDTCHGQNYYEYTCYSCHDHQENEIIQQHSEAGITEQDIPACVKCHPDGIVNAAERVP